MTLKKIFLKTTVLDYHSLKQKTVENSRKQLFSIAFDSLQHQFL